MYRDKRDDTLYAEATSLFVTVPSTVLPGPKNIDIIRRATDKATAQAADTFKG